MVDKVTTFVELVGAVCVVVAAWAVAWNLGLLVAGLMLLAVGVLGAR